MKGIGPKIRILCNQHNDPFLLGYHDTCIKCTSFGCRVLNIQTPAAHTACTPDTHHLMSMISSQQLDPSLGI